MDTSCWVLPKDHKRTGSWHHPDPGLGSRLDRKVQEEPFLLTHRSGQIPQAIRRRLPMRVSSTADTIRHHPPEDEGTAQIEFAIPAEGGNSSAGEKYDFEEKAVRLAWWNADGGFDPISSAELPEWAILDVMEACAAQDFLSPHDAALVIRVLAESIERQCGIVSQ